MSNLPKVSFSEAAVNLSVLCNKIDNVEEDIDALLVAEFEDALTNVTASIDRRKAFYREVESKIEMAKQFRDEVTKHIKRYESIKERLVEVTKQVIEANPSIPFKDSMGKQLKVIDNPTPKLVYGASIHEIDPVYVKEVTTREIDKDKIKEDLLAGKKLDFAHLEYGKQLRGMK